MAKAWRRLRCFKSVTRASDVLQNFDPASARSIPSLQHIACPPEGERTERISPFIQVSGTGLLSLLIGRMQSNLSSEKECLAGEGYHCFSSQVWHGTRSPTPPDVSIPLRNWQNDTVGDFILPGSIFNVPVRKDILQRVVRWQMAKRQQVRPP